MPDPVTQAKLEISVCNTVGDFLLKLEAWNGANGGKPLWYRGTAAYPKPLQPSLYRHPTATNYVDLQEKVRQWFLQRGIPFLDRNLASVWEELFYMQHFGFPTRLLDWSENPLIALYFAIHDPGASDFGPHIHVWVLSPADWNAQALGQLDVGILDISSPHLRGFEPNGGVVLQRFPAALYGAHNSRRIAAQRGVFTIFGSGTESISEVYENETAMASPALKRIDLPVANLDALKRGLAAFGVSHSLVMQDLNSLAREAKELYKFNV